MHASSPDHATIALARCPLDRGHGSFSNSHCPSSEDTFRVDAPTWIPIYAVDRGLATDSRAPGARAASGGELVSGEERPEQGLHVSARPAEPLGDGRTGQARLGGP